MDHRNNNFNTVHLTAYYNYIRLQSNKQKKYTIIIIMRKLFLAKHAVLVGRLAVCVCVSVWFGSLVEFDSGDPKSKAVLV